MTATPDVMTDSQYLIDREGDSVTLRHRAHLSGDELLQMYAELIDLGYSIPDGRTLTTYRKENGVLYAYLEIGEPWPLNHSSRGRYLPISATPR